MEVSPRRPVAALRTGEGRGREAAVRADVETKPATDDALTSRAVTARCVRRLMMVMVAECWAYLLEKIMRSSLGIGLDLSRLKKIRGVKKIVTPSSLGRWIDQHHRNHRQARWLHNVGRQGAQG